MLRNQVAHPAGAYPTFHSMKHKKSITTLPWIGCQSMARLIPPPFNFSLRFPDSSPVPIYTPGWVGRVGRGTVKENYFTHESNANDSAMSQSRNLILPDLFMTFMKLFKPVFFSGLDFRNGRQSWSTPKSRDGQQHWKSEHISCYEVNCFHCNPHYFPQLV